MVITNTVTVTTVVTTSGSSRWIPTERVNGKSGDQELEQDDKQGDSRQDGESSSNRRWPHSSIGIVAGVVTTVAAFRCHCTNHSPKNSMEFTEEMNELEWRTKELLF